MRQKLRFLVCQVDFAAKTPQEAFAAGQLATVSDLFAVLRASIQESFGDAGMGACLPQLAVKYYSPVTRICVVKAPAAMANEVHAALVFIKVLKGYPVAIRLLQSCGSLRTLKRALLHWHMELTAGLRKSVATGAAGGAAGGSKAEEESLQTLLEGLEAELDLS